MDGQSSCNNITDFRPSAVQSATIQPQSRVLKGKPPYERKTGFCSTVEVCSFKWAISDRLTSRGIFFCGLRLMGTGFCEFYLVHLSVVLLVFRRILRNLVKWKGIRHKNLYLKAVDIHITCLSYLNVLDISKYMYVFFCMIMKSM